jgi:uncharacterized surface protein with fasciclin (FAS1) repeats
MLNRRTFAVSLATAAIAVSLSSLARADSPGTIVDVAAGAPHFSTLVAAVKAAGLAGTLAGPGPFTVFAPTNDAFAKLPAGTVESLLKPENIAKLKAILLYHVVAGNLKSTDLKSGDVATADNKDVNVQVSGGSVKINDATVTKADIPASNGVIHVIDTVLIPPPS